MLAEITKDRFQTHLFDEWESQLASTIGHHSSCLLTPEIAFASSMEVIRSGDVTTVALEGRSSLRLYRHQGPDQIVLWLPRMGWVEERVNGQSLVAEPGTAMLCLPGDELLGVTTPYLAGVSMVFPASLLGERLAWQRFPQRLLGHSREAVSAIHMAQEIRKAMENASNDVGKLVASLADQLIYWRDISSQPTSQQLLCSVDRHRLISQARDWIDAHLNHPFRIAELAAALHVSCRSLQYCFSEELGHSPLLEVRRIRFYRLRQKLMTTIEREKPTEALFQQCGLTYTSLTSRQYREWCGETPRQTRARSSVRSDSGAGAYPSEG
jgi:AraC-like DNA-binding protein